MIQFKTQEEIKTSHEYPVSFALYNNEFEAVVSADDGSFIALWDIESGKLMSKFGDAHGVSLNIFIFVREPRLLLDVLIKLREDLLRQVAMALHACGTSVTVNA